jgi:hypothetical protein
MVTHMTPRLALLIPFLLLAGCASEPLTGAWRSQVSGSSGYFSTVKDLEFLYVFNKGGTMTESSNYDAAPPGPPAYGVWRTLGPGQFEAVYVFFPTRPPEKTDQVTQGWAPAGRGQLRERIKLARDAKSFESTITLQLFDPAGHPAPGGGQADGRATRIDFDEEP